MDVLSTANKLSSDVYSEERIVHPKPFLDVCSCLLTLIDVAGAMPAGWGSVNSNV